MDDGLGMWSDFRSGSLLPHIDLMAVVCCVLQRGDETIFTSEIDIYGAYQSIVLSAENVCVIRLNDYCAFYSVHSAFNCLFCIPSNGTYWYKRLPHNHLFFPFASSIWNKDKSEKILNLCRDLLVWRLYFMQILSLDTSWILHLSILQFKINLLCRPNENTKSTGSFPPLAVCSTMMCYDLNLKPVSDQYCSPSIRFLSYSHASVSSQ